MAAVGLRLHFIFFCIMVFIHSGHHCFVQTRDFSLTVYNILHPAITARLWRHAVVRYIALITKHLFLSGSIAALRLEEVMPFKPDHARSREDLDPLTRITEKTPEQRKF